jgi:DNA-binding NarL/FixJ family response regulator
VKNSIRGSIEIMPPTWPRVLIAEDDEMLRGALAELLAGQGFQVVGQASDGEEALALARKLVPDVALVDYRMPGMNGVDLTAYLKEEVPLIEVVMLTAYADQSLNLDAVRSGVHSYLVKGCSPSLIMQTVHRAWLDKQEMEVSAKEDGQI